MMKILRLEIQTDTIDKLDEFYNERFGFEIIHRTNSTISFKIGRSELVFLNTGQKSIHHLAFNIPYQLVEEALKWLEQRVEVLPVNSEGERIETSNAWKAASIYFLDPLGHVLELIGRKKLDLPGTRPFDTKDIFEISEVGLPCKNIAASYKEIKYLLGLEIIRRVGKSLKAIFAGDEHGMFIMVSEGHIWHPTKTVLAKPYPFSIKLEVMSAVHQIDLPLY